MSIMPSEKLQVHSILYRFFFLAQIWALKGFTWGLKPLYLALPISCYMNLLLRLVLEIGCVALCWNSWKILHFGTFYWWTCDSFSYMLSSLHYAYVILISYNSYDTNYLSSILNLNFLNHVLWHYLYTISIIITISSWIVVGPKYFAQWVIINPFP